MLQADSITHEEFNLALAKYPALSKKLSRPAKAGEGTLEELDTFRYEVAVERYRSWRLDFDCKPMEKSDLNKLVEWKLKHGTYRPSLAKLVDSNKKEDISEATKLVVVGHYLQPVMMTLFDAIRILDERLKGVGPATASLILSVYFPKTVGYLADESFFWLVNGGKKMKMSYKGREWGAMKVHLDALCKRLDVSALDVEKVAFVLVREHQEAESHKTDVQKVEREVQKAKNEVRKAKNEVKQAKKEVENLEEYVEKTEGYVEAVREKLKDTKQHENSDNAAIIPPSAGKIGIKRRKSDVAGAGAAEPRRSKRRRSE